VKNSLGRVDDFHEWMRFCPTFERGLNK